MGIIRLKPSTMDQQSLCSPDHVLCPQVSNENENTQIDLSRAYIKPTKGK